MTSDIENQIRKCFKDTYMETEGDTELFDTEETIQAIKSLITKEIKQAQLNTAMNIRETYNHSPKLFAVLLDGLINELNKD